MALAQTMSAEVAPRFRSAARAMLRTDTESLEVVVAEGFALRLRGLARLAPTEFVPLLFPRCRSLHTFGMRGPIDVVSLEIRQGEGTVRAIEGLVEPRRLVRAPRGVPRGRCAALELPAGDAERLGLELGTPITLSLRR